MANEVYDDQKQSEAEVLRGLEEDLAGSKAAKIASGHAEKAGDQPKNTASPENLLSAEKTGRGGANPISKGGGLGSKTDMALNGVGGALASKGQNWLQKNRKKAIVAGAGGIVGIGIIGLILFFIGLLSLPNYAENIAARNLAKVTRAAQKSTQNVMREKNAIASLTDDDHVQAKNKYQNLKSKTFERIDRLRPNKVIQNLGTQNYLQYHYEKTKLGRERLVAISFSTDGGKTGQLIRLENPGFFESKLHPVRTLENRLDMQRQIATALNNAIKLNNPKVPTAVRAIAVKNFMKNKLGVSLKGIIASRYLGKEPREARITMQQEAYAQIKDKNSANSFTNSELKEATNDANAAEERCVQDPKCVGKTVDNPGEIPAEVADEIDKRVNPDRMSGLAKAGNAIVGTINPIYDIALPVCLVYDGSRLSPESVDTRSNQSQRTGAMVMSTADQQKDGSAINAEAVGAMNWKLGDTNQSNALKQAQGEQVDTLANTPSTQASAIGGFGEVTIFNALLDGVSKDAADSLNSIADGNCETLTSIWFGVGVGVLNVVVTGITAVFTGGGTAVAQITITQALKQAVFAGLKAVSQKVLETFTTKAGFKAFLKAAYKEGKFIGAVEAATFIAKAIVGLHAFTGNGLAVGESFANDADNGINQLGNNMNRVNYGGRAMTDAETVESMNADTELLQSLNSEKSTFERYFALDNPNSMLTHVGMDLNTALTTNVAGSMLTKVSGVFNPLAAAPKLFGSLNNKVASAAGDVAKRNYGNVQFGWTEAELKLIDETPSYNSPSENEYELDKRGDRAEIEQEYSSCLDETIGKVLGEKWIERNNDTGDVAVDKGKCSPKYMGPNNPDYGDGVFRYRLFRFYEGPLTTLEGIEKPVDPATVQQNSGSSGGGTGTIPSGTAQELAQKIVDEAKKDGGNISFQTPGQLTAMEYIAQTGRARQCGAPAIDPNLLGVMLAISQKYKVIFGVVVDGHSCNGGYHPKGQAVDINGVATDADKGTTADNRKITFGTEGPNEWATVPLLKTFYQDIANTLKQSGGGGMGQIQCFSAGNKPAPVQSVQFFEDKCHHIHIDTRR